MKTYRIVRIITLVLISSLLLSSTSCGIIDTITGKKDHEEKLANCMEAAEKSANSDVYKQLGILPDKFSSEVIYEDEDDEKLLVGVRYALEGANDWSGAYVMYMSLGGTILSQTKMLPSGYDFDDNLDELKALFGL